MKLEAEHNCVLVHNQQFNDNSIFMVQNIVIHWLSIFNLKSNEVGNAEKVWPN